MKLEKYNRPFMFYSIAFFVPWVLWFTAGGISRSGLWDNHGWMTFASILIAVGALAPMSAALALIFPDKDLRKELLSALFNYKNINWKWWAFHFLFPTASILAAMAVSLLFGYSTGQFRLNPNLNFSGLGIFPAWAVMFAAPVIEEFGWHTYGIHAIRRRFNLFTTCFVFGIIWAVWHIPLSFIANSYQSVVIETGPLHSINYLVSIIPYLIINNWGFYKTRRFLFFQVIFHFLMNFSNEIFQTHPDTKIIQTIMLLVFSAVIVLREKKFFFDKAYNQDSGSN
jgi:membrane protease YdiL (CAAX protease family)